MQNNIYWMVHCNALQQIARLFLSSEVFLLLFAGLKYWFGVRVQTLIGGNDSPYWKLKHPLTLGLTRWTLYQNAGMQMTGPWNAVQFWGAIFV